MSPMTNVLTLCGLFCFLGFGKAWGGLRHQEGKGLEISYAKPSGTITGDFLLVTNLQNQDLRFSPLQGEFFYEGGNLRVERDGEFFQLENLGLFLDGYKEAHFQNINYLIKDDFFRFSWGAMVGKSNRGGAHAGKLNFKCKGKIEAEELDEREKFIQACINGITSMEMDSYGVDPAESLLADPLMHTLALELGEMFKDVEGRPFSEKGFIPTDFIDIKLNIQKNQFQLTFSTDSFFSVGGVVAGTIRQDKEKKVLHIFIEKAVLAHLPFRAILFKMMGSFQSGQQVIFDEPFIHFNYGP